jgi:uncharacterized membrane protein
MVAFVISLMLHTLAAVVWVGGLFFVHYTLLPSLDGIDRNERFTVLARVVPVFVRWVWASIVVILVTGYGVLLLGYRGGIGGGGIHIDIMQALGLIMIALFGYMDLFPWRLFLRARAAGELDKAESRLGTVRFLIGITLILGLITAAVGATGSLWAN